jgi:hypothetical protein
MRSSTSINKESLDRTEAPLRPPRDLEIFPGGHDEDRDSAVRRAHLGIDAAGRQSVDTVIDRDAQMLKPSLDSCSDGR